MPNAALLDALDAHPAAHLVAVVHAETSTGAEHPLRELGEALRRLRRAADGRLRDVARRHPARRRGLAVDYAYSCTQKCLGGPPGLAPVAISAARVGADRARGARRCRSRSTCARCARYWVARPVTYHHTAPILAVYALHEALRCVLEEGLEPRWARHAAAAATLRAALDARGLELLAAPGRELAPLTAVRVPAGVDGNDVRTRLLAGHGIEIGGGLGPDAPPIWRIGLMGRNATGAIAGRVVTALDAVLETSGAVALA